MLTPILTIGWIEEDTRNTIDDEDATDRKKRLAHLIQAELIELKTLLEEYSKED